jgi:hypothetical protein
MMVNEIDPFPSWSGRRTHHLKHGKYAPRRLLGSMPRSLAHRRGK